MSHPLPQHSESGDHFTAQQLVAITNIALLAEECTRPRHGKRSPLGTVIVTVNAGYE